MKVVYATSKERRERKLSSYEGSNCLSRHCLSEPVVYTIFKIHEFILSYHKLLTAPWCVKHTLVGCSIISCFFFWKLFKSGWASKWTVNATFPDSFNKYLNTRARAPKLFWNLRVTFSLCIESYHIRKGLNTR